MGVYLEIIVRYLHFIAVFVIVATVSAEYILLKDKLERSEIRRILKLDRLYGIAAIVLLGAGFSLWFVLGKPATFYTYNVFFWIKLSLFTVVGILSIYPTMFFIREGKKSLPNTEIHLPKYIKRVVLWEMILLALIPFCAGLMAKGISYFG